jgi:hypothetical protein
MHLTRISDDEEIRIGDQLAVQYSSGQPSLTPEEIALVDLDDITGVAPSTLVMAAEYASQVFTY